ncbi:MAG: DNA mismatch repair endonuclease MutL [Myxococcales bacterium]|nr:DNA mismatch repair endonuclease MutL [Myxococcales bacterium]
MGRIQVLDDALADQIAAGEVVERPASAAKELMENALDAGATAITVEIADGGVARLRVVDDGHGMPPEDAVLALRRHATSKLRTTEDLVRIATLGFRGEALPSIAAVSRFRLRTREPDALGATVVRVEGGGPPEVSQDAGPVGTEILVEDLFYNIPARRKFLKQATTEAAHVQDAAQRLALGAPGVAMRLIKDGRVALDLPRHASLSDRVAALFGTKVARDLTPVAVEGALAMSGLIGSPETARSTPRHYFTFINGRFVRDRVIMAAVQSAYGHRLGRGQHPFVVLHLTLPVDLLDVNVHPAKTEVRFSDTRVIHRLVSQGIHRALEAPPPPASEPTTPTATPRTYTLRSGDAPPAVVQARKVFDGLERQVRSAGGLRGALPREPRREAQAHLPLTPPPARPAPAAPTRVSYQPAAGAAALPLAQLPVLGELAGLLLLRAEDALLGVDVEAARAQVAHAALAAGRPGVELSPPLTVALDDAAQASLARRREAVQALGFEVEPFGGRSFAIHRAPAGLPAVDAPRHLADLLAADDGDVAALRWRCARRIAHLAAPLAAPERGALLEAVAAVEPSGGPAWIFALTAAELRRALGHGQPT